MYSGKNEDVGNNQDGVDMRHRCSGSISASLSSSCTGPTAGTIACIHIQQLVTYKIQHGYAGRRDFRGAVVDMFSSGGWEWCGEVVIRRIRR